MSDDNLTIFVAADFWHMLILGAAFGLGALGAMSITLVSSEMLRKLWLAAVMWWLSRRARR